MKFGRFCFGIGILSTALSFYIFLLSGKNSIDGFALVICAVIWFFDYTLFEW